MTTAMRQSTLETLGLGSVLEIFRRGRLPVDAGELVDRVFGSPGQRGSLVVSGANGIVGAGKTMQLGSRLAPYDVRVVALDFPAAPDGIGKQYPGLVRAFGREGADRIMANIIKLTYDGAHLPAELGVFGHGSCSRRFRRSSRSRRPTTRCSARASPRSRSVP